MSVKTHRDWARKVKGITAPEMYAISHTPNIQLMMMLRVIASSAHAAFWKASQYFGIKLRVIPVDEITRKADVSWMKRAMSVFLLSLDIAKEVETQIR